MVKGRVLGLLHRLITDGASGDELAKRFDSEKSNNTPRFANAMGKWGENIMEEAKYYNHSVVAIQTITLDIPVPVFNMTVCGKHNYIIGNGVLSKNCDADPDGGHITCLLLMLFFKHMRKVIEDGHLYVCDLPLYKVRIGGKQSYLKDDEALSDFKKEHPNSKIEISRFKGLGEMNSEELAETAMNPKTRSLKKIHIQDAIEATQVFECLMGNDIVARKKFLGEELELGEDV